jgi:streptomycin 6-kinase
VAGTGLKRETWLERVPNLLDECVAEWGLRLGAPYEAGVAGYTVRADLPDGTLAVLKLIYPHREAEQEAEALRAWHGDGAVRLLAHDPERWSMLLERCEPGTQLAESPPGDVLTVMIGLLPRLWKRAGAPFSTLAEEVEWWLSYLPEEWDRLGEPFERSLLEAALEALEAQAASQGEPVLLHQDLHGDNVLAARREPWLVIDPKPLVGEREFAVAPIVRDFELGHTKEGVLARLDRLTSELGLDKERARWWTIGQSLAWFSMEDLVIHRNIEVARWLAEES